MAAWQQQRYRRLGGSARAGFVAPIAASMLFLGAASPAQAQPPQAGGSQLSIPCLNSDDSECDGLLGLPVDIDQALDLTGAVGDPDNEDAERAARKAARRAAKQNDDGERAARRAAKQAKAQRDALEAAQEAARQNAFEDTLEAARDAAQKAAKEAAKEAERENRKRAEREQASREKAERDAEQAAAERAAERAEREAREAAREALKAGRPSGSSGDDSRDDRNNGGISIPFPIAGPQCSDSDEPSCSGVEPGRSVRIDVEKPDADEKDKGKDRDKSDDKDKGKDRDKSDDKGKDEDKDDDDERNGFNAVVPSTAPPASSRPKRSVSSDRPVARSQSSAPAPRPSLNPLPRRPAPAAPLEKAPPSGVPLDEALNLLGPITVRDAPAAQSLDVETGQRGGLTSPWLFALAVVLSAAGGAILYNERRPGSSRRFAWIGPRSANMTSSRMHDDEDDPSWDVQPQRSRTWAILRRVGEALRRAFGPRTWG